jgi:hypothetical protein
MGPTEAEQTFAVKHPRPPVRSAPMVGMTRYRCTACGNLTRFDVTSTRRTRAFHHYSVGGELRIEDAEVLTETVDDVVCRWCGTGSSVVGTAEAAADAGPGETGAPS